MGEQCRNRGTYARYKKMRSNDLVSLFTMERSSPTQRVLVVATFNKSDHTYQIYKMFPISATPYITTVTPADDWVKIMHHKTKKSNSKRATPDEIHIKLS